MTLMSLIDSIRRASHTREIPFGTPLAKHPHMGEQLGAPAGMRSAVLRIGDEDLLVIRYELDELEIPRTLTLAERGVAEALLRGSSMASIAKERGTARRTIANQLRAIYAKVGVTSRLELVAKLRARSGEANAHWRDLLDGKWTPLFVFAVEGRRYMLAARQPNGRWLSQQEESVLHHRARALGIKQIVARVSLSAATVRRLLASGMKKLGLVSASELARFD
jgi:DNA-binding NarL/FixJ family response regulator